MKQFKKGDKIRLNASLGYGAKNSQFAFDQLEDGKIYEVYRGVHQDKDGLNWLVIYTNKEKTDTNSYNPDQFELVEEKIEKWAIKNTGYSVSDWFNKNSQTDFREFQHSELTNWYLHYPVLPKSVHAHLDVLTGYTEVTYEWFQKNILKIDMKVKESLEEFPEKWSVLGGEDFIKILNELKNKKILHTIYAGDSVSYFYNFDGKDLTRTDLAKFKIVTIQELKNKYFVEKKQTGWKIKKEYLAAVNKITHCSYPSDGTFLKTYDFMISSLSEEILKNHNVLELFCEPVYEEEKKDVILTIGANSHNVIINKKITVEGVNIDFIKLKEVVSKYHTNTTLSNWSVYMDNSVRVISIGCGKFSINELNNVIREYENWNK